MTSPGGPEQLRGSRGSVPERLSNLSRNRLAQNVKGGRVRNRQRQRATRDVPSAISERERKRVMPTGRGGPCEPQRGIGCQARGNGARGDSYSANGASVPGDSQATFVGNADLAVRKRLSLHNNVSHFLFPR